MASRNGGLAVLNEEARAKKDALQVIQRDSKMKSIYDKITKIAVNLSADVMKRSYQIGVEAQPLVDSAAFGDGATDTMALALGLHASRLRGMIRVSRAFSNAQIRLLCDKVIKGKGATYEHLLLLSSIEDAAERNAMLGKVLSEGLSVRALRDLRSTKTRRQRQSARDVAFGDCISKLLQMSTTFNDTLAEELERPLFGALEDLTLDEGDTETVEQLVAIRDNLERLDNIAQARITQLTETINRFDTEAVVAGAGDDGEVADVEERSEDE
jgi:hypothetical protein